jgi:hypothetical protein
MKVGREKPQTEYLLLAIVFHELLETSSTCVQVTWVKGWGSLAGPNEVKVKLTEGGEQIIRTKNIMIATGSEVVSLPGVEIDEKRCVHFISIFFPIPMFFVLPLTAEHEPSTHTYDDWHLMH